MNALLILVPIAPFLVALVTTLLPQTRGGLRWLLPVVAIPAVVVPLAGTVETDTVPWLLLETQVGLDTSGRVFLFLAGVLWGIAGWYARAYMANDEHEVRFQAFYLLAMSGNFGLAVAGDVVTFYAAFALMTFAAAGLIVYDATRFAVKATSTYLILSLIGESLLLAGLFQAAMAAGSIELAGVPAAISGEANRDWTMGFLFTGFGIKAGIPLLHMWLPLAHPAAPTPASAVLSGVMIKAGLLGWIRFLPLGFDDFAAWGWLCICTGLVAAIFGVAFGIVQTNPKVNLAYSSVSQMGLMTMALGLGLLDGAAWAAVLPVLLMYALHHGLAKGTLFLGVGVVGSVAASPRARALTFAGLGMAALALAGAPLTSGAIAKGMLKDNLHLAGDWYTALTWMLSLSSIATALLMARFLFLVRGEMRAGKHGTGTGLVAPWGVLVASVLGAVWLAPKVFDIDAGSGTEISAAKLWDGAWPVLAAAVLVWAGWRQRARLTWAEGSIPPGDVGIVAEWVFGRAVRPGVTGAGVFAGSAAVHWSTYSSTITGWIGADWPARTESRLASWRYLGIVAVVSVLGLVGLLSW